MMQVSLFHCRGIAAVRSFVILHILTGVLLLGCSNAQSDVPPIEQRAQALNRSIMCPVCPGESIDQSQVALAVQMRGIVDEKLSEGWSEDQIREFFVERYGPSVLLQPPTEGVSLLAWLIPPIGVAAAVTVFVLALRHMRRRGTASNGHTDDADLQPYYTRIEASVSGNDRDDRE